MKKFAFIFAISLLGTLAVNAINPIKPAVQAADQILYCKIFNNTATAFEFKANGNIVTIDVNTSAPVALEENTQLQKKDSNGNWVNWFIFSTTYANQTVQLTDLLANN